MTCLSASDWATFGVCIGDTVMMAGMLVHLVCVLAWLITSKWIPALFASRNRVNIVKLIASAIGTFAALWLSVSRLALQSDRSLYDFTLVAAVTLTFIASFIAALLNKTACSAVPTYVLGTSWLMCGALVPRVCVRAEITGNTEDNSVRTMFVAAGALSICYLVPKTAISFALTKSPLLTPALSKLCIDGLRICFEVMFITRLLGTSTLNWMAVFAPALMLDGACLLWLLQKYWSNRSTEERIAWEAAETGVITWSVFAGFPWGTISAIMWTVAADVWGWQPDPADASSRTFPSRFLVPFFLLSFCAALFFTYKVTKLPVPATWTQLKRKTITAAAFCGILFTCNIPLVTIIVKVEQPGVTLSWGGAYTPLLLVLIVAIGLAVRRWYSLLKYRTLAGSDFFTVMSEQYMLLSSEGIQIPNIHRPVLSIAHWMAAGDAVQLLALFLTACVAVKKASYQEVISLETFATLLAGEVFTVACTLATVARTTIVPYMRVMLSVRKAAVAVDAAVFTSATDSPEELFPVTEASPLLALAAMSTHRGSRDAFDTPGEFPIAIGTGLAPIEVTIAKSTSRSHCWMDVSDTTKCVVCLTHQREILLRPCKHAVLCKSCAAGTNTTGGYNITTCPVCRTPVLNRERIFL